MKRLLLVKLGAIGDVVMCIPAAYAMHLAGYEVDWVCGRGVVPILKLYPWINAIEVDERKLLRGGKGEQLRLLLSVWRLLLGRSYDLCATLYYDRRYRLLTLPVRAARRVSLSQDERAFQLLPGRHHTDEYARILSGRGDDETPHQLAPVSPETLPAPSCPRKAGTLRIVLVPGGARNMLRDDALRRWPVASYVAIANALLERGHEVVLSGGTEDTWVVPSFAGMPVEDAVGKLSLVETLALLHSADVSVTHDTGPLHLAGITSTAIVAVFGPTDPRGRLPQRANCVALWGGEGFACRPCYDGQNYAPCTHNGCVRQVTAEMVLAEIDILLAARQSGRSLPPRVLAPEHTLPLPLVQIAGSEA